MVKGKVQSSKPQAIEGRMATRSSTRRTGASGESQQQTSNLSSSKTQNKKTVKTKSKGTQTFQQDPKPFTRIHRRNKKSQDIAEDTGDTTDGELHDTPKVADASNLLRLRLSNRRNDVSNRQSRWELIDKETPQLEDIQELIRGKTKKAKRVVLVDEEDMPLVEYLVDNPPPKLPDNSNLNQEAHEEAHKDMPTENVNVTSTLDLQDQADTEFYKNLVDDHQRRLADVPTSQEFKAYEARQKQMEGYLKKTMQYGQNMQHIILDYITEGRKKEITRLEYENQTLSARFEELKAKFEKVQRELEEYKRWERGPNLTTSYEQSPGNAIISQSTRGIDGRLRQPLNVNTSYPYSGPTELVNPNRRTEEQGRDDPGPSYSQEYVATAILSSPLRTDRRAEQYPPLRASIKIDALLNPAPKSSSHKRRYSGEENDTERHDPRRRLLDDEEEQR